MSQLLLATGQTDIQMEESFHPVFQNQMVTQCHNQELLHSALLKRDNKKIGQMIHTKFVKVTTRFLIVKKINVSAGQLLQG